MTTKLAVSRFALTKKIAGGDPFWHEFNSSFVNKDLSTDMILQAVYDGHAITTQHKNNWRTSENYLCGQFLGLDFDQGDKTSSIPYLMNEKFISKYAAFLYTTMSHTEEAPRARVVFVLDEPIMQAKNYALAASSLLWLYGTADRSCKDAARFWYGSPKCQCEYLDNVLPLEVVKKLIANYQETGNQERRKAARPGYLPPASQQEVADALKMIDPWRISYDQWLEILMGIHAEFGQAGLSLAESWADGKPSLNGGVSEVERKFRSFDQTGNGTGAITIATVFGIAKDFGWKKYAELAI